MQSFTVETGIVAPLLAPNIDTDVIMPKQFLKGIDRNGLAKGVFHHQRFLASGAENPDFVLNQAPWRRSKFLAVGANFGCGSSREHAVWGLKQLGIRALIGTTYGGIFYDNCQRNGLLVIKLDEARMQSVAERVSDPALGDISIDLPAQTIHLGQDLKVDFDIDPIRKEALLSGLDAIGSTLTKMEKIREFERGHLDSQPWLK